MARQISRAEAWERAHEVFTRINFNSFDYDTIKESLIDYTKLYFAEDFNDYIESSEFIAILELFAYVGELLAYRLDLNAHENLITAAQRKESILRLVTFISYKATRNIPARGLVKITSIHTSESITDSQGKILTNKQILWNDSNNPNWKEQFLLVMNRVLEQDFGTVTPNERVQVDDVLFELYSLNNSPLTTGGPSVVKYNATVNGTSYPMELTPVSLTSDGPEEKRPERNAKLSLLYGSDGLGDGSDTTGFFLFTKQGTLRVQEAAFDGITPNQTYNIAIDNINETDVWLNNVDPDTRAIIEQDIRQQLLPHLSYGETRFGEWVEVDVANAQNIIFNTNKNRHKYEVETLDNDNINLIFGDGEFSDIPAGSFDVWYRTSANEELVIPKVSVADQSASFSYIDATGSTQTLTFTFSLINSLQNASPSEDIEHIRRVAPSVYYTQDRMVNGRDYNTFMLQDPSILKMRTINRTFAGDSKYIAWHDPKEYYEDVKIFGDDLALYWAENDPTSGNTVTISTAATAEEVLNNYIEPLLCSTDFFAVIGPKLEQLQINPSDMRCTFNTENVPYSFDPTSNETSAITAALNTAMVATPSFDLYYSAIYDEWTVSWSSSGHPCDNESSLPPYGSPVISGCTKGPAESTWMARITAQFSGGSSTISGWLVQWRTRRLIVHSETTNFWNTNDTSRVINYDTLDSIADTVVVLKANTTAAGTGILAANHNFSVLGQELIEQNLASAGLPDTHKLSVLPEDVNQDGIADNLSQPSLMQTTYDNSPGSFTIDGTGYILTLPDSRTIVQALDSDMNKELEVYIDGVRYKFGDGLSVPTTDIIATQVQCTTSFSTATNIVLIFNEQTYQMFDTDHWIPIDPTDGNRTLWAVDAADGIQGTYRRFAGRYPLNFAWMHTTPNLHLVDPAASNIHDMFIITRGYYTSLRRYLENKSDIEPTPPTPRELRSSYSTLLENKMFSDTVVLHPGKFKTIFGPRSVPELRATFKVIRPQTSNLTDNEVKVRIVSVIRSFFDIDSWEFGETFYFTEMAASIHANLGPEIDSIVIVPTNSQNHFGALFEVEAREDEVFMPDINTSDIQIVQSYTSEGIRQT